MKQDARTAALSSTRVVDRKDAYNYALLVFFGSCFLAVARFSRSSWTYYLGGNILSLFLTFRGFSIFVIFVFVLFTYYLIITTIIIFIVYTSCIYIS